MQTLDRAATSDQILSDTFYLPQKLILVPISGILSSFDPKPVGIGGLIAKLLLSDRKLELTNTLLLLIIAMTYHHLDVAAVEIT